MDLLEQHHRGGVHFEPGELVEQDARVAVEVAGGAWKVFTFVGDRAVLLHDCTGRDDALGRLAAG